jgi:hypothetical protein
MKQWRLNILITFIAVLLTAWTNYAMYNDIIGMWQSTFLYFFLIILAPVLGTHFTKKRNGGIISFRDAFIICLIIMFITIVLSQLFGYTYIAQCTDLEKNEMMDSIIETKLEQEDFMLIDELELEDQIRSQIEQNFKFTPLTIVMNMGLIFIASIFALLIALSMRKEIEPV